MTDRTYKVKIGDEEYELLLSVTATIAINKKYGDLENIFKILTNTEDPDITMFYETIIWLITLLANQGIGLYNLYHKNEPKPALTVEAVGLLVSPYDIADYVEPIVLAMTKGSERFVKSEDDPSKNPQNE